MTEPTKYRAPALEKGLDILELLATVSKGLTQKEIAQALGRSLNEIFRMLVCLSERGYITAQEGSDRYELTLKMFELSHRHPPINRLVEKAVPVMRSLSQVIEQSCHLTVFKNNQLLIVAQVDSPSNVGFGVRFGSILKSLTKTGSGQMILAFSSVEVRKEMLASASEAYTPELELTLDKIKKTGYVESPSSYINGIYNQSFPVFDHNDEIVAALNVPFVKKLDGISLSKPQVRAELKTSSLAISKSLGAA